MLKWLTITLIAVVVFATLLLGLGYLLKEHKITTTHLKQQLDQERAEKKLKQKGNTFIETSLIDVVNKQSLPSKTAYLTKQKILIKNLTCSSKVQCVLVEIQFADLHCPFAINKIGASLLAKTAEDISKVGKCPRYPTNSQLSCLNNLCTYGDINN
jgi:Sec-independent protein translocase protein TatA